MMDNLKVKVNSEAERKEVQELFFKLGCYIDYPKKCLDDAVILFSESCGLLTYSSTETYTNDGVAYKEITPKELRDLVVLKRNDVNDATHENCMFPYIKLSDGWYYFDDEIKKWLKSTGGKPEYFEKLKPIEKKITETEYLMQGKNGEHLIESVGQLDSGKIVSAFVVGDEEKHSHYRKSVKHLDFIDPYRIAQLYDLHPCADHIAKKALCTGKRGHKDLMRDIQDIIDTAERWKQMIQEDQNAL